MGFIDYIHHRTEVCGVAKITCADAAITMTESDSSLGSCTDKEEADVSNTERLSFSTKRSIPVPYSFEPSDTELIKQFLREF